MVAVAFILQFVHSGILIYGFSLFVKPLQEDFGCARGAIMVAFTILMACMGGLAPIIGRLVDRYGTKRIIVAGALVTGAGFSLLSWVNNLWLLYIDYIIIGVGGTAIGPLPCTALISNWFQKKRGWAIGIMGIGVGTGGLVMAPLIGGFLIPTLGWRTTYVLLGILVCVLITPIAVALVKTKPADIGLYPDGADTPAKIATDKASSSGTGKGFTLKPALKTPTFWLITMSYTLFSFPLQGILQNQVPYLTDIGFLKTAAAAALGFVGMGSAVGKFLFGWICDFIKPKYLLAIGIVLQALATIVLMNIGPSSPAAVIWIYSVLFGIGIGCWLPCISMLISNSFGMIAYGAIYGMATLIHLPASAIGPIIAGAIYDTTGRYHLAFIIFLVLYAVALLLALLIRPPKLLSKKETIYSNIHS